MSSLFIDFVESDVKDFSVLAIKASHVDVHPSRPVSYESHVSLTQLRSIIFGKTWYQDKVASCTCSDLTLYRVADEAYTVCKAHGVQAIGRLVRADPTFGKGMKVVKAEATA